MAFRTILIEKARKVNLDLNSIVVNYDEKDFNINLDEISTIVFDDPRCMISLKLLARLCEEGISVIFTNESHNPIGSINTLAKHSRSSKKISQQVKWQEEITNFLWMKIVEQKIKNQINTLRKIGKSDKLNILENYITNIEYKDITNREGLASRIYFKEMFGNDFKRFNEEIINYCLNYGYQLIRSKIAQEIVCSGYITQLGINHKSEYNTYNLADDFIEPYRPIIDYFVFNILNNCIYDYLTPELKQKLVSILNEIIIFNNSKMKLHTSIKFYVQSLLSFIELGEIDKISFPELK